MGEEKDGKGWKRKTHDSICICSPLTYIDYTPVEGMEWQEMGKGESVVSLLINEHDEVKLQSYGLETTCINC